MYLLPKPQEIDMKEGNFIIRPTTEIVLHNSCDLKVLQSAKIIQKEIEDILGFSLKITKSLSKNRENSIILKKDINFNIKSTKLNGNVDKIKSEAYEMCISFKSIVINAKENKGIFYGAQTLRQIIRNKGIELPCLKISDWPQFSERGFYHDVTRGKVPTLQTLKELVDRASMYKINQLQLYVEHSFAFTNHSEIWSGNDPLTAEEILELDEYCKEKNVELVPSLASFGHLYHALTSKSFNDLCELEDSYGKAFSWIERMGHHTLNVTDERSIEFVRDMFEEFIPLFSSDKFNICCDETFDLGKGKSKEEAERIGVGRLYVDFLKKIIDIVRVNNKKPMFWSDIIIKYPELLCELPQDVICLNWNYSPEATDKNTKIIAQSELPQYVCPGVSGWDKFINDLDGSFENIKRMSQYGKEYNAVGILNTDWGDYGHINLFANSMPGMIYGAALSWNTEDIQDISEVDKAISRLEFKDKSDKIVSVLRELSRAHVITFMETVWWKEDRFNQSKLLKNKPEYKDKYILNIKEDKIHEGYNKAQELEVEILKLMAEVPKEVKNDYKEFYISSRAVAVLNSLYLIIKKYDLNEDVQKLIHEPKELAREIEYFLNDFCSIWRMRNKESELQRVKDTFRDICVFLREI